MSDEEKARIDYDKKGFFWSRFFMFSNSKKNKCFFIIIDGVEYVRRGNTLFNVKEFFKVNTTV